MIEITGKWEREKTKEYIKTKTMEIKTKFNIGDTVYPIFLSMDVVFETCKTCNGVGSVKINNTDNPRRFFQLYWLLQSSHHECKS